MKEKNIGQPILQSEESEVGMSKVIDMYGGDQRLQSLYNDLISFVHKRADGLPIPPIIGVLRLLKLEIVDSTDDGQ